MNKLTAEECRKEIRIWERLEQTVGLAISSEKHLQAYRIALPVLEQQESKRQVTLREAVSEVRKLTEESGGYNFEALRAEQDNNEWISCIERMPEDDTLCLGFDDEGITWTAHFDCGALIPDCGADDVIFTHWMPLPAPPQSNPSTTPQIDNDGWMEWGGGDENPAAGKFVQVKFRDGMTDDEQPSSGYRWYHEPNDSDIIAYRVIENDGREG